MDIPVLTLSTETPIAQGKTRWVFQHPQDESVLIKVHRSRLQEGTENAWKRREDRFLYRTGILRELAVYVDSRYGPRHPIVEHIAPVYGVVDTDLGPGFAVAAARDIFGELAPTVLELRREGQMTPARAHALDGLFELILDTDLLIGDLNQENIVLSQAGSEREKFMLIDGLGERTWLPVQRWCVRIARRQKRVFVRKMRRRLRRDGLL